MQEELEIALSIVADSQVSTVCAGRTDTGVHALNQVVHFETLVDRDDYSWVYGSNSNLPKDISLNWCVRTIDAFHARYAATSRTYNYLILNRKYRSGFTHDTATWISRRLDETKMALAANSLAGEHDFSSFRARGCQAKSPIKKIKEISVSRVGDYVIISIKADGFLQRMVRNIAGLLIEIGSGRRSPSWAREVLVAKNRSKGGITAPSSGLYLMNVMYPKRYGIPEKSEFVVLGAQCDYNFLFA